MQTAGITTETTVLMIGLTETATTTADATTETGTEETTATTEGTAGVSTAAHQDLTLTASGTRLEPARVIEV